MRDYIEIKLIKKKQIILEEKYDNEYFRERNLISTPFLELQVCVMTDMMQCLLIIFISYSWS